MKTIQFSKFEIKIFFKELVQELEIMVLAKINVRMGRDAGRHQKHFS
jgi:hypothetical protein